MRFQFHRMCGSTGSLVTWNSFSIDDNSPTPTTSGANENFRQKSIPKYSFCRSEGHRSNDMRSSEAVNLSSWDGSGTPPVASSSISRFPPDISDTE
ncbi:uncharacterized protein [Drosophila takahashii]|uniref:uncharacterized protein isoform X2 n=1 Tax=Drosophila takahashii TaxID=29030 RepID=UPI0038995DE8